VTEIRETGAKAKTKVYAGGAVIAEQVDNPNSSDFVFWIHADPITGSSQKTEKSGESYDYLRTELEPLGQEVLPVEPPQVPVDGIPAVRFSASEPEWLCRYPNKEYSQMPVACQQAENESLAYQVIWTESSPARITHTGGQRPPAQEQSMPVNLSPTEKSHGNADAGSAIAEASLPDNDGDVDMGKWEVTVRASMVDVTDTGVVEASQSGQISDNPYRRNPKQGQCDYRLSRIFGDMDAYMSTAVKPPVLNANGTRQRFEDVTIYPGGESPANGVSHLYSNWDGIGSDISYAFTPPGYEPVTDADKGPSFGFGDDPQNFTRVFYKPGKLAKYGHKGGLYINFTHIGPADKSRNPLWTPDSDIQNPAGSHRIGVVGGFGSPVSVGGSSGGFNTHVHMIFRVWDGKSKSQIKGRLIDPRSVFCKDLGF
jgi:hypothetical protein